MEGGGEDAALADEDGEAVAAGEDFDFRAGFNHARGADKDHFERIGAEFSGSGEDAGVDLAAVGVTLDDGIKQTKTSLWRVKNFAGEEDGAGAGSEDGFMSGEFLESIEKVTALEKLEHGGGFAAGKDEGVGVGELFRLADFDGFRAGFDEGLGVGGEVALDGEDADVGMGTAICGVGLLLTLFFFFRSEPFDEALIAFPAECQKVVA